MRRSGSQSRLLKLLTWCRITSGDRAETDVTSRGTSMDKAVMHTVRWSGNDRTALMDRIQVLRDRASTAMESFMRILTGHTHNRKTGCLRVVLCGKKGHKSYNCPDKKAGNGHSHISRVITPCPIAPKYIEGRVGKYKCRMLLDSGADRSVVHPSIVESCEWIGKHVMIKGVNGVPMKCPLAEI